MTRKLTPIHPGEILYEDFMVPFGLSSNALAKHLGVPANRVSAIVKGTRAITADTALRLERIFGSSPDFWLNLQSRYELETAKDTVSGLDVIKPLKLDDQKGWAAPA